MTPLRWLSSFWGNLFHKSRMDEELDEELRSYVELLTEEKISLNGYPGRMITLSLLANGHEVTGESRIFVVGKRVYSLSFLRLKDATIPDSEDAGSGHRREHGHLQFR